MDGWMDKGRVYKFKPLAKHNYRFPVHVLSQLDKVFLLEHARLGLGNSYCEKYKQAKESEVLLPENDKNQCCVYVGGKLRLILAMVKNPNTAEP